MLVATLYLGVLSSSPQEPILEQTGRGADVQMCHNLAHGDLLGYGVWGVRYWCMCGRPRVQFIPGGVW